MNRLRITAKSHIFEKARIVSGLTQRELARRTGLSHAYVSLVERGTRSVGPSAAKRLCEALDMPMEELFVIE